MYHSITIGTKNTWDDWHLIPKSRPLFNPGEPKTAYIDIPGGHGSIDLSEAISGKPIFANRTGSWDFYVDTDFEEWITIYSEIMNYLRGRKYNCFLEDDPNNVYNGRFYVGKWKTEAQRSIITINYTVNNAPNDDLAIELVVTGDDAVITPEEYVSVTNDAMTLLEPFELSVNVYGEANLTRGAD